MEIEVQKVIEIETDDRPLFEPEIIETPEPEKIEVPEPEPVHVGTKVGV